MNEYVDHGWWENAALIKILGYNSLLHEGPDAFSEDVLAHIKFLDYETWNYIPAICRPGCDPVIQHYAGVPQADRRVLVPQLALAACFREFEQVQSVARQHAGVCKGFISGPRSVLAELMERTMVAIFGRRSGGRS